MKSFLEFLTESVIDPENDTLDPLIFENPEENRYPKILESVRQQILMLVKEFEYMVQIEDVWIKGSILTKNYSPRSDIDVTIITKSEGSMDDDDTWDYTKAMSGKNAGLSNHPINFFINFIKTKKDLKNIIDNFDNIYSLMKNSWLKKTKDYSVDVDKYMNSFKDSISNIDLETMSLRRDLIDFNSIKKFPKGMNKKLKAMAEKKLKSIETSIKRMISDADKTKKGRLMVFKKPISLTELNKIRSKNTLPENVIFKLAERYYYFELIKELDKILDNNKIEDEDVIDIQDALENFFSKTEA